MKVDLLITIYNNIGFILVMEFKFNVQGELFCNREGFTTIKLEHLLREDYENTPVIMEVITKLR